MQDAEEPELLWRVGSKGAKSRDTTRLFAFIGRENEPAHKPTRARNGNFFNAIFVVFVVGIPTSGLMRDGCLQCCRECVQKWCGM
jgi:hypothetical protein